MGNRLSLFSLAAIHSGLTMLLTMAVPYCGHAAAPDTSTPLQIKVAGAGEQRTTELNWTSVPGAIYKVQSRDALNAVTPWSTIDVVQPPGTAGVFKLTPDKMEAGAEGVRRSRFFQLALPQPEIFRVEPAVLSTEGGEIYVLGQCLTTNGTLRVGGVAAPFVPGGAILSAFRCTVPPMAPGVYDVEWLEGGVVVAAGEKLVTFASVRPGDSLQRHLEPPVEPPASPMKVRKGGVVTGSININNGNRTGGKKGLNAVNVKLAFTRDGGGDDDSDPFVSRHNAVATSAALGFPIAFAGTLGYIWAGWNLPPMQSTLAASTLLSGNLGYLYLPGLVIIAIASMCTAPLGAKTAHKIDIAPLKKVFAGVLYVLAAYFLLH